MAVNELRELSLSQIGLNRPFSQQTRCLVKAGVINNACVLLKCDNESARATPAAKWICIFHTLCQINMSLFNSVPAGQLYTPENKSDTQRSPKGAFVWFINHLIKLAQIMR